MSSNIVQNRYKGIKKTNLKPVRSIPVGSVIYNKETLSHFSSKEVGTNQQKNDFISTYYRKRNLSLANQLEQTMFADKKLVNKAIRNLRWCGATCMVEENQNNVASILQTSQSCKNPHCARCARSRSAKLSSRLIKSIQAKENHKLFKGKYFYFMTCTVKHNSSTRKGVYLKEFRSYMLKLTRRKNWLNQFGKKDGKWSGGWIRNIECTIGKNGYHIHSHVLVVGDKLKGRVLNFEKELREDWAQITKDSWNIQFDLLKGLSAEDVISNKNEKAAKLMGVVKEVYKYTVKSKPIETWNNSDAIMYAEWIQKTGGKNFVNVSGLFRGLKLTGAKSEHDTQVVPRVPIEGMSYYAGRTSKIKFNYRTNCEYGNKTRKYILKQVYLKSINTSFIDVTEVAKEILEYVKIPWSEKDSDRNLQMLILAEKKARLELNRIIEKENMRLSIEQKEMMRKNAQLKLFRMEGKQIRTGFIDGF